MSNFLAAYEAMAEANTPASDSASNQSSPLETWLDDMKKKLPNLAEKNKFDGPKILSEFTLKGIADRISEKKAQCIIVMSGAGLSTSAGIPDFRSPDTGLYANIRKQYDLPDPQAIFEIDYFKSNPEPFFTLAKDLFPQELKPTMGHYFIRLLHDKGLLLRTYTQNIDTLEHIAGIPAERIVEAHGSYHTNTCMGCKKKYSLDWIREKMNSGVTVPRCHGCQAVVKPDVVFFGESLPKRFFSSAQSDFPMCDLLIIMGTSLVVQPFCGLVNQVTDHVPRLLINKEKVGERHLLERLMGMSGLDFDAKDNYRDIFWEGSCDDGCLELARLLGWQDDLKSLIEKEHQKLNDQKRAPSTNATVDSKM